MLRYQFFNISTTAILKQNAGSIQKATSRILGYFRTQGTSKRAFLLKNSNLNMLTIAIFSLHDIGYGTRKNNRLFWQPEEETVLQNGRRIYFQYIYGILKTFFLIINMVNTQYVYHTIV